MKLEGTLSASDPEPTNHPTSFTCGTPTSSTIPLSWTDATGGTVPAGYLVKWSTTSYAAISDPADSIPESNGTGIQNINQGVQAYTFTSLTPNTTYYFKIWPYTNSGSNIDYKLMPAPQQTSCATTVGPLWGNAITDSDPSTSNPYTNGQTVAANITVSGIGRGSGIAASSASNRYSASGWNTSSLDINKYFYFTLTPNGGYEIDFTNFVYTGQASGTGPVNFAVRSSLDGYTANIGSATAGGTTIDLSGATYKNISSSITFRFYGWGASAAGGTFSINDFTFNGTVNYTGAASPSQASDIIIDDPAFTYNSDIDYTAFQGSLITNTSHSIDVMRFIIRDGGGFADADAFPTILSSITFSSIGSIGIIRNAALFDGNAQLANNPTINTGAGTITFSGLNISTNTDGGSRIISLRVSFYNTSSAITDNSQMSFTVTNANVTAAGSSTSSLFTTFSPFTSSTTGNRNRIEVTANHLAFVQQPSNTGIGSTMTPNPSVEALDINNVRDLDYDTTIAITSTGSLNSSPQNAIPVSGLATFTSIIHNAAGTGLTLSATSGSLTGTGPSSTFDITASTVSSDYFRTVTSGNWNNVSTWESSPDGNTWISATLPPTQAANIITIRNGHTVTVNADVTFDQTVIEATGELVRGNNTLITLSNGSGDDLTIYGKLRILSSGSGDDYADVISYNSGSKILVKTGGIIEFNGPGGSDHHSYAIEPITRIEYEHDAVFRWNPPNSLSFASSGITYFPGVSSSVIPIFRCNVSVFVGGGAPLVINGVFETESGKTVTFQNAGSKTFRNGIRGAGNVTQNATAGNQFLITGTAELGGGNLTLNTTAGGLSILSTSTTTLISNKTIDSGPISVAGTFDLSSYAISGTYSSFAVSGSAVVKTAHTDGLRSATGALQNNSATYNFNVSGTSVEYTRLGAQTVTNNDYYNLSFRGNGDKTLAGNTTVYGDISWLNLSGTPTLKCGSYTLDVKGNWSNDSGSNFDPGTGTVNYGSTGNTRTISGTNSFNIIKIFGTVNLTGGTLNIYNRIEVPTGAVLNTNGNLTLQSGGSLLHGTGTPLGGGTVNGNITVRRTGNSGSYTYNYWCSPVSSADVSVLGSNLYYYNPANATDLTESGLRAGWVAASGTMTQGLGYISTGGGTVSFTGTAGNAPTGTPITVDVKKNVGTSNNVPWNLVGNPFPSSLDADLFIDVNGPLGSGAIAGALYFWDDDNSGGDGWATNDYAVWTKAGTTPGSPTMSNNGRTPNGHIATGQSFFVNKTADGTSALQFQNSMRSSNNNVFFRQKPIQRFWVNISNPNNEINEALIAFIDDATDSVDLLYDAQKLKGNAHISVYTKIGNDDFAIQALPELTQDRVIPVGMDVGTAGNHTFRLSYSENLDETVTMVLEDRLLNHFQCLNEDSDYVFYTNAGTGISRFYIHINPPVQVNVVDESCSGLDGEISIFQPGAKTWDYVLYNDIGQLITSGTGFNGNLSFAGLKGGEYNLALTDQHGFSLLKNITVTGKTAVLAGFTPDNLIVATDLPVHFTNNSAGATSYEWNFGDGTVLTGIREPEHAYTQEGTFIVTLKAFNDNCSDLMTQEISVFDVATGSVDEAEDKVYISTIGEYILVRFDYRQEKKAELSVHNILGQKVFETKTITSGETKIDLRGSSEQYYFLTIKEADKTLIAKIIISGNQSNLRQNYCHKFRCSQ